MAEPASFPTARSNSNLGSSLADAIGSAAASSSNAIAGGVSGAAGSNAGGGAAGAPSAGGNAQTSAGGNPAVGASAAAPAKQQHRRLLAMGPSDCGKTSMTRVVFENWEPARTQYQGKTSMAVREEIFLFGRRVFSFFDCGGQVSYFDGYLKDPYLFNDCAALVFVIDATLFFLQQDQDITDRDRETARTWSPQTIRDIFSKTVTALRDKSPDARVFLMFNKMDKVASSATVNLSVEQIDLVLAESAQRLQQQTVDIFNRAPHRASGAAEAEGGDHANQAVTAAGAEGGEGSGAVSSAGGGGGGGAAKEGDADCSRAPTLDEQVPCFRTSIFGNSIMDAWSSVLVQLLEPQAAVAVLRQWLERIRASAGGEILEACIVDSSTLLTVACSTAFGRTPLASEAAIRAKRQRLKGLEYVSITHRDYNLVWQPLLPHRLQLLLVGDARLSSPGVTQLNAERIADAFCSRFVDDRLPPPWPEDVVQVKQLLGII